MLTRCLAWTHGKKLGEMFRRDSRSVYVSDGKCSFTIAFRTTFTRRANSSIVASDG